MLIEAALAGPCSGLPGHGSRLWSSGPQQPRELRHVQPMPADRRAIEQQHRDVQPVPSRELGVGIDIHHFDGRQAPRPRKRLQLCEHFVAEIAAFPMDEGQRRGGPCKDMLGAEIAGGGADKPGDDSDGTGVVGLGNWPEAGFTEFAMNSTVSGGTSPTAVTL